MMSTRIAASLFVAVASLGGVAALAAPASAAPAAPAASEASAASGSCYFYDNLNNQPGACADETTNYFEGNVGVWNDPNDPTTQVATGTAGQVFKSIDYVSNGRSTTCDNGVTTTYWYHGIDAVSRQTGWVPDCYLNGEPS
ncbi:hypothetical protein ABH920_009345 [Catenulispora sp. EB89]|uniref:hypothetical protein n=1 Tax=Catenulispora sp. EB89 TaxID=3156257 RepID=UPI003517400D